MNFNYKKRKLNNSTSTCDEEASSFNIITKGDHIYFYEDVDSPQILELISQIKDLQFELAQSSNPIIHLHLYSYGGDAHLGFSMYDFIKNLPIKTYTYIDGMIASAATFIYLAGEQDL